jgi:hypothetical protein
MVALIFTRINVAAQRSHHWCNVQLTDLVNGLIGRYTGKEVTNTEAVASSIQEARVLGLLSHPPANHPANRRNVETDARASAALYLRSPRRFVTGDLGRRKSISHNVGSARGGTGDERSSGIPILITASKVHTTRNLSKTLPFFFAEFKVDET